MRCKVSMDAAIRLPIRPEPYSAPAGRWPSPQRRRRDGDAFRRAWHWGLRFLALLICPYTIIGRVDFVEHGSSSHDDHLLAIRLILIEPQCFVFRAIVTTPKEEKLLYD
jgi:hypothetical protein